MKKLIILLLGFVVLFSCSAKSQDSINRWDKKQKATMFAIIAVSMAPTIFVVSNSTREDKVGRVIFGVFSAMSVASGIASLCYSEKRKVLHYTLFFTAGLMDGFNEEITHHYYLVKTKLPSLNDQWFDPSISWQNKHNAKYPFAKTLLVGTTDAYHASRTLNKMFVLGGIFTFDRPKTFKQEVLKTLGICVSYSCGKGLVHYLIQR